MHFSDSRDHAPGVGSEDFGLISVYVCVLCVDAFRGQKVVLDPLDLVL